VIKLTNDGLRKALIAIGLICIICLVGFVTYIKKEDWFKRVVKINYFDGCTEVYENEVMVTPNCSYAKQMIADKEAREKMYNDGSQWNNLKVNLNVTS
jgi:hypothetical protein